MAVHVLTRVDDCLDLWIIILNILVFVSCRFGSEGHFPLPAQEAGAQTTSAGKTWENSPNPAAYSNIPVFVVRRVHDLPRDCWTSLI